MTTTSQALSALAAKVAAENLPYPVVWQGERFTMPDIPTTFAYAELLVDHVEIVAFGGGRSNNVHRHFCTLDGYVFSPSGAGAQVAIDAGELFAASLRSYRDAAVSCFTAAVKPGGEGAELKPPGMQSAVDGYYWARVEVKLFFDLIG